VRAGLLSDPRVVVALRTLFVPVHLSALNTPHCMRDPRDVELLRGYAGVDTDRFIGGEREAFLLPGGAMQRVFLSLNQGAISQYTAATRRAESATREFRHHGAIALRDVHGDLPAEWRLLWDGEHEALAAVAAEPPRWPQPATGEQGFRVFVRNSYKMYDDLHGAQIASMTVAQVERWLAPLRAAGDRAGLAREAFTALARAMVPRGQVDTELRPQSIDGALELVAETVDERHVRGRVEGTFALTPADKDEVGKRRGAAALFASHGRLAGRFAFDRAAGTFVALRVAAHDVRFEWNPGVAPEPSWFAPWHRVGIEWVAAPPPPPAR
jgi:hypothetical protein